MCVNWRTSHVHARWDGVPVMASRAILLSGAPAVTLNGTPAKIRRNKSMALLAYLALAQAAVRRDALAALLWPEQDQAHARADLRRELTHLRDVLGAQRLEADRETVALVNVPHFDIDVLAFQSLVNEFSQRAWTPGAMPAGLAAELAQKAAGLYRGNFLEGFSLRDAPEFDAWQYYTAEDLRRQYAYLLDQIILAQRAHRELDAASISARRRLALDPLDETSHATLIELYLDAGSRSAALAQYERCVDLLEKELDVLPSPELAELGEAIRHHHGARPAALPEPVPGQPDGTAAEIRTVVALSLCALPDEAGRGGIDSLRALDRLDSYLFSCREKLLQAGATIVYTSAESTLAAFGLSLVREDDAERCMQCALDLRDAAVADGLAVAIGVAAGMAHVRDGYDAGDTGEMVMGAVLHRAGDLQHSAAHHQVYADRATFRLTRGSVDYGPEIDVTVHGCALQVREARRLRMEPTKSRGLSGMHSRMVGRDTELARLRAAMAAARSGEGQVAFVVGDAGLGKSRLVAELRTLGGDGDARPAGRWLTGRCRESTSTVGFAPFAELLRLYFGWEPSAGPEQRVGAMTKVLADLVQRGYLAAGSAEEIAAVLGTLYAVQFDDLRDDLLRHADPAQVRHRSLMALATLLVAIAHQCPLVLVLEDLHWADPASIDLLGELLTRLAGTRLLLICVFRPGDSHACVRLPALAARRAAERSTEIALRELSRTDLYRLVDGLFERHQLSPDMMERIFTQSQGNPYFAEEIVRALIDGGAIVRDGGAWRAASTVAGTTGSEIALSPGISNLLLSRIDGIDRSLRLLLQSAAVLGSSFDLRVLSAIQEMPDAERTMHELEQRGFVLCERQTPYAEYSFRHALLHDAVYATIPAPRRSSLHAHAAQAILQLLGEEDESQVEQLARHYMNTDNHAAAVHWLVRAGAKARRSYLNDQACRYFEMALERCELLDPTGSDDKCKSIMADTFLQLGRVQQSSGAFDAAEHSLRMALSLAESTLWSVQRIIEVTYWLGEALFWQGKHEELNREAIIGLERLSTDIPSVSHVLMLGHWVAAMYSIGRHEAAGPIFEAIEDAILNLPFSEELSPAFDHVIDHQTIDKKDPVAAKMWIDELNARAVSYHDLNSETRAVFAESTLQHALGDMEGSKEAAYRALDLVKVTGEKTLHIFAVVRLAEAAFSIGDLETAIRFAEPGLDLVADGQTGSELHSASLGAILLGAGQLDVALNVLSRASQTGKLPANLRQHALLWLARAQIAAGDAEAAVMTCQAGLQLGYPETLPFCTLPLFRSMLAGFLATLDAALDDPVAFRATCDELRQLHAHFASPEFQFWYLQPGAPDEMPELIVDARFAGPLPDDWQWIAPGNGATLSVDDGLRIEAAEACDLWHLNFQAPRLVKEMQGDFAIEATCRRTLGSALPMGGLCLWGNNADFVRLDSGAMGENEVTLAGSIANKDRFVGRGRLVGDTIHLRLERRRDRVRGLCSGDGIAWSLVGETEWVWSGILLAGPYVIGLVDRTLYPGAPPHGGVLCFDTVRIWQA